MSGEEALTEWVRSHMTLEKPDLLLQVKERVAHLLGVSTDGTVAFRLEAHQLSRLTSGDRILLYMLGKLFAQAAGYASDDTVTNSELQTHLGMPEGTVRGQLTTLRRERWVNPSEAGKHSLAKNRISEVLGSIEKKVVTA